MLESLRIKLEINEFLIWRCRSDLLHPNRRDLPLKISNQTNKIPPVSSPKKTNKELTAEDYYQIYKRSKESVGPTKKTLERKSSFTSPSTSSKTENRTRESVSRSKSFSAYSAKPGHSVSNERLRDSSGDRLSVDEVVDSDVKANIIMLEQNNQKPTEITKVTGGIAER